VQATLAIVIAAAAIIPIDQTWLQNNGPAPYVLSQAGATYQLETDVTTSGTAFVILNQNITLDLNGHTVTYGNSTPVTVTNGGFESGSGTNLPGWNLSGAPAAAIASNTNHLFGNQVFRLSNFSTTQTIVSSPIAINTPNHTYTATITPAGQLKLKRHPLSHRHSLGQDAGLGSIGERAERFLGGGHLHANDDRPGQASSSGNADHKAGHARSRPGYSHPLA